MNVQNIILYMDGNFESSEFAAIPELPATVVAAVLTVTTVVNSTPVVLEVTTGWESEVPVNPETNR